MEETPKSLIEGFIQTAQTHQTEVPKRWKHALIRTPDKIPSPGVDTRSTTKRKRQDLPDKTPRAMIETYMTNAKTEHLSTVRTRRRRSFPAAPVNVTVDNFTPRTNIAMLIEQGVEETPYVRPQTRRSSRKSLPALPVSDSIQLLPMSPSIEEDRSGMNSSRRRTRRSNTGLIQTNTTESASKKRRSSTGHLTRSTLEGISDSIHLLPDLSSGDEAVDADDSRERMPIRRSPRSNLTSSSQMFGFKEVLSSYKETKEDSVDTDGNLSENVLVPSSQDETTSNSSPVRVPNTEEIQGSPNQTSIDDSRRTNKTSVDDSRRTNKTSDDSRHTNKTSVGDSRHTNKTSDDSRHTNKTSVGDSRHMNKTLVDDSRHTNERSVDDSRHTNERSVDDSRHTNQTSVDDSRHTNQTSVDDSRRSSSVYIPETQEDNMTADSRTPESSPSKPLPSSQSEDGAEADDESEENEECPDTLDKFSNVSGNAVEVVGSDRNRSKPELVTSVKPVDNNENEHSNSIFDKSTSLVDMEGQGDINVRRSTDMAAPSTGGSRLIPGMEDQGDKRVRGNTDIAIPSTGVADEDREVSNEQTSVREMVEEEEDEGDAEADFVLDEGSPHMEEEEEEPIDKDFDMESEGELEETEEMTEDITENFRLAKTPKLATPQNSKGPGLQPLTDILNRESALPLRSVNEVLRDTGDTTRPYVKKTQRKTKAKTRQTAPLPVSVIKNVFNHYCKMKVSADVLPELINVTEKFFKQVPADLEAYCHHAGRKTIDDTDVELLMKRQRLIKDNNSLDVLIEENLPLEYRLQLIPIARAGNIVHPRK
ncbi:uncharacterized protein LOC117338009 [Pecten maximus]|uniref:uncharacterized protein LOC117338009 n=1 Tax=Pecten maximus TaxID=6579 RepID=UPI001458CBED|nr:uncharacterized protein LOC117338009 [Pecten maximus]XP_033755063.1 uncharacterized protein LOC117338009 [Pecten maximus]